MAQQAQDTFSAEIDGAPMLVHRGQVFPDNHPVVKLDAGRGLLFRPLEVDEPEPKKAAPARKTAAKAVTSGAAER